MKGRRIFCDAAEGAFFEDAKHSIGIPFFDIRNGDYWVNRQGWAAKTPNGLFVNLSKHTVAELENGTITASPSILVNGGADGLSWHGFLECGEWREC